MNFTETEQKVREATNEDPWGISFNFILKIIKFCSLKDQQGQKCRKLRV